MFWISSFKILTYACVTGPVKKMSEFWRLVDAVVLPESYSLLWLWTSSKFLTPWSLFLPNLFGLSERHSCLPDRKTLRRSFKLHSGHATITLSHETSRCSSISLLYFICLHFGHGTHSFGHSSAKWFWSYETENFLVLLHLLGQSCIRASQLWARCWSRS